MRGEQFVELGSLILGGFPGANPDHEQGAEPLCHVENGQRDLDPHPGGERFVEVVGPAQLGWDRQAVAGQVDRLVHAAVLGITGQPESERQPFPYRFADHL